MFVLALVAFVTRLSHAHISTSLYSGPYSIFNVGHGQSYHYDPLTCAQPSLACLQTTAAPVPLSAFYDRQPIYTRVIRAKRDTDNIDNICSTMFRSPDDPYTYIIYDSTVYCNGSYGVTTSIYAQVGVGTYIKAGATTTLDQRIMAFDGDETYAACENPAFGEDTGRTIFVSSVVNRDPLSPQSLNNIRNILRSNGQDPCNLYILPYNRPTRCIIQQTCSLTNAFIK